MKKYYYGNESPSLGILDVLALIFIVLKLLGIVEWSWWWVLAPWWIPALIICVCAFANWLDS